MNPSDVQRSILDLQERMKKLDGMAHAPVDLRPAIMEIVLEAMEQEFEKRRIEGHQPRKEGMTPEDACQAYVDKTISKDLQPLYAQSVGMIKAGWFAALKWKSEEERLAIRQSIPQTLDELLEKQMDDSIKP